MNRRRLILSIIIILTLCIIFVAAISSDGSKWYTNTALTSIFIVAGISLAVVGWLSSRRLTLGGGRYSLASKKLNINSVNHSSSSTEGNPITERKVYSQNGEDGILESIFSIIGEGTKYYVEFGVENGDECNSRYLRESAGWKGLMMDVDFYKPEINLRKELVTVDNIRSLFEKYNVPYEFDLLSIDVDGNDYLIWKELSSSKNKQNYRPRVVIIEYNSALLPPMDAHVEYDPTFSWTLGSVYFGGSICALTRLGRTLGYTLLCSDNVGVNLVFIRTDILIPYISRFGSNLGNPLKLHRSPTYGQKGKGWELPLPHGRDWVQNNTDITDIFNRVVIYGNRNCGVTTKIITSCEYNRYTPVVYYEDTIENAPHEFCRLVFIVNDAKCSKYLSSFTFVISGNFNNGIILLLARLMVGTSGGISNNGDEDIDNRVIEVVTLDLTNDGTMRDLLEFPTSMGVPTRVYAHRKYYIESNEYTVGEKAYSGNITEKNYEIEYHMRVASTDITIQDKLKKHTLFDQEVTAAGSQYARQPEKVGRAVVYDVGGNVGCVGIPLSHSADFVIAFEPFERTFVLYEENIRRNKAFNTIVMFAAVGDYVKKQVFLSDHIDQPKNTKLPSGDIVTSAGQRNKIDPRKPTEFGGVRLGLGGQPIQMTTLDVITSCLPPATYVSLIKADIEGAEALAFKGATHTITEYKPCIIIEKNERDIDDEMLKSTGSILPEFTSLEFIKNTGYNNIYELRLEDYMFLPPNRHPAYIDSAIKYVRKTGNLKEFTQNEVAGMDVYKLKPLYT